MTMRLHQGGDVPSDGPRSVFITSRIHRPITCHHSSQEPGSVGGRFMIGPYPWGHGSMAARHKGRWHRPVPGTHLARRPRGLSHLRSGACPRAGSRGPEWHREASHRTSGASVDVSTTCTGYTGTPPWSAQQVLERVLGAVQRHRALTMLADADEARDERGLLVPASKETYGCLHARQRSGSGPSTRRTSASRGCAPTWSTASSGSSVARPRPRCGSPRSSWPWAAPSARCGIFFVRTARCAAASTTTSDGSARSSGERGSGSRRPAATISTDRHAMAGWCAAMSTERRSDRDTRSRRCIASTSPRDGLSSSRLTAATSRHGRSTSCPDHGRPGQRPLKARRAAARLAGDPRGPSALSPRCFPWARRSW